MSQEITPSEVLLASPSLLVGPTPMLTRRAIWVMAAACGAAVANTYYNQPLLSDFAAYFHSRATTAGLVATAAQVGYGVGLLFLVPLGDLVERRRLIIALAWFSSILLVGMAAAPTLGFLIGMQLLVGIAGVGSQVLIPLGIDLTPPAERGNTVGTLMAGLLAGILLARTVAGCLGEAVGWRATYAVAAVVMVIDGFVLFVELPHHPPSLRLSYGKLMHSMLHLLNDHPPLRTASIVSGLSFAGFTAFWTSLSFLMAAQFHKGSSAAGMFGIVGVAGAMAAPLAGRLSDRRGPPFTVTLSIAATAVAFLIMWRWVNFPGLIVGVLLMDLGVQSIQVAEQSLIMALVPSARSRLNTVYMVARFMGGAAGSAMGAYAWSRFGWSGVCALCLILCAASAAVHYLGPRPVHAAA